MRQIFYNEDYQREFLRKGYITMKMLSDEEVTYLRDVAKKLEPSDQFDPTEEEHGFSFHTTLMDSNIEYKKKANRLIHEFFTYRMKKILVNYKILTGGYFVKPPFGGDVVVHRDWTYSDNFTDTNVNFWCPLVDVDEKNGALQMVDGTHKLVSNIECPKVLPFFSHFSESLKKNSTPIPLKAGEALFFENTILHWSTINQTNVQRWATTFMSVPNEARSVFYYPRDINGEDRFEVFEMSSASFNEHTGIDFLSGKLRTKSLGFVENSNREINKDEFLAMIAHGAEIREKIYSNSAN